MISGFQLLSNIFIHNNSTIILNFTFQHRAKKEFLFCWVFSIDMQWPLEYALIICRWKLSRNTESNGKIMHLNGGDKSMPDSESKTITKSK